MLNAREPGSAERASFGPQDTIYLITPDRFANGDPSNDTVQGHARRTRPVASRSAVTAATSRASSNHLDYLAGMGYTQLWLNPVLENNQPEVTYHGYAITDFYKVDPRFGTNEGFRQLAADARQRGVGMIMDMVLNHCGSQHWWMKDLPSRDWFNNDSTVRRARATCARPLQDTHATSEDRQDVLRRLVRRDDAGHEPAQSVPGDVPDPEQPLVGRVRRASPASASTPIRTRTVHS